MKIIKYCIARILAIFFGIATLIFVIAHYELIKYDPLTGTTSDIWGFPTTKFDYDNPLFTTTFSLIPRLKYILTTTHNVIGSIIFIIGASITYILWQLSKKYEK